MENENVGAQVSDARDLFNGRSGAWATERLAKGAQSGVMNTSALRTLDTLRHEEWKYFDDALVEEALIRLVGVQDLLGAGLTRTVSNALGKMVYAYEKLTFMDEAEVSLGGLSKTNNDVQEFSFNQLPLPIIHKDYFLNLRMLTASREKGEPIDTIQARTAGRVVAEKAEKLLFQGGPTYFGSPIYGYTTFPSRKTSGFDTSKNWGDLTKTGSSYIKDVMTALALLQSTTNRMYGPYWIYVPADAGVAIENDYNPGTANTQTIRARIEAVKAIKGIRVADQLPTGNVVFVQATLDVAAWVQGDSLQNVQWEAQGGFMINFKAWMIGVPLLRSDPQGRCGICHLA